MSVLRRDDVPLDPESFRAIADFAYRESGLTLVGGKTTMIQSRLRHRLDALGLTDFPAYCAYVRSTKGRSERQHLISALTTNVSSFFREKHHFDSFCLHLDGLLDDLRNGAKLRIWSAGCANGQEALSIAMSLLEHAPELANLNVRILATDIDPKVINFARTGIYDARQVSGVPKSLLVKYFAADVDGETGETAYRAAPAIRDIIRYNTLNLLGEWPIRTRFDAIFCRNVVIYFDVETQRRLWPRLRAVLQPAGILCLGHSERIQNPENFGFYCSKPTTYHALD
tara:strand:+ start:197 stop:1048 length:852 start_codon:yes stop_codon:yes gene_type:complete